MARTIFIASLPSITLICIAWAFSFTLWQMLAGLGLIGVTIGSTMALVFHKGE
jgi:hypothetical protein